MELWIRSQDKDSLIKVERIELIYDLSSKDIQLIHIETDKGRIGSYETKERALEILDEIQNILSKPQSHEEDETTYYMPNDGSSKIYEMPKE